MSGANSTPLGRLNPVIGSGKSPVGASLLNPSYLHGGMMGGGGGMMGGGVGGGSVAIKPPALMEFTTLKRDHDDRRESSEERKRRRKSRWGGDEKEKAFIPGMPTVLPNNLNKQQEEAYLVQLQIEEISRKLRTGELGIPANPEDRSPSPEPIYSSDGKRLNTREYRTRKKLEEDRHNCIIRMQTLNPEYKPPSDYKPPIVRVSDKVMIPQDDHPDINFVGLLIGPRGNTLKSMERDTGAKIIIRGKGSVKEGKVGRKDGQPLPGEDEPLHAYVTANNPDSVKKAVERINEIIRQGVEVPEGQNDLRKMQLRELALLNGTLRENDGPRCSNCGAGNHKAWQCPDKPNVTNNVLCTNCGGAGHIARDCRQKRPGLGGPAMGPDRSRIDEEYMSLMAELGEGPPPPKDDMMPNQQGGGGRGGFHNRRGGGASSNVFEHQGPPRALMAPPPPQRNQPPSLMSQPVQPPPPWNGNRGGGGQGQGGQGGGGWNQGGGGGGGNYPALPPPPGTMIQGPPPPPPPGSSSPTSCWQPPPPSQLPPPPWQQQQQPPPPPMVPPPNRPPHQQHHMYQQQQQWQQQQHYMGVPPPQGHNSNMDLNMLAQSGLPSLLVAPPPPPPNEN